MGWGKTTTTLTEAVRAARRVYIAGNGGSAANAIHMANDLISAGVKAHALTADVATLTAIANDYGYKHVFARQIAVFGEPGDLLIAMSGSGQSENIVEAINAAKAKGMVTYAITGRYHEGARPVMDAADHCMPFGRDMQDA